ncbi:uncharacterized protein PAC_00980 [Phialocephala subalpina]|uniref:BTB domain-containing protein n=1 Tax=Phialocephala subalpina TaxID=576137 RepID=A0A1L7WE96_9HELO|nr:uncharacterized protein PAC_00980 [Phialocephala subalpina]
METPENQESESDAGTNTNSESGSVAVDVALTDDHWKVPSFSEPAAMVIFLAGPDDKIEKFLVHKDVVYFWSIVLKAAFNSGFIEGNPQTYRLPDGRLPLAFSTEPSFPEQAGEDLALAELWILADKLLIPSLQNLLVTRMVRIENRYKKAPSETFNYVYENTAAGSTLRDLAVHKCARLTPRAVVIRQTSDLIPKQLLVDLLLPYRRKL